METTTPGLLTLIIFLPLAGALILLLMPRENVNAIRWFTLAVTAVAFLLSLRLYFGFDAGSAGMQFREFALWMPQFGIHYHLGIDGISLWLVLLTTFLTVLSVAFSWVVEQRVKEYMFFMLLLETGMLGVFCALDLVLFYVFWEAMLVPMYFLIGMWGGERRIYAAIKFFLFTFFGSILMLVAIVALYYLHRDMTGMATFDLLKIQQALATSPLPIYLQLWLFAAFALAFAIKVPMFPFHTWLPDAHVEAPTAGSVILAGVLLKMGTYGFLRFCLPLFPDASQVAAPLMLTLAVIGIIYGAIVAAVQPDVKKLVAYSSVSHLGFVMLGLFALNAQGLTGSILQQVNHGISTGALFLLVGMIYERRHTRLIAELGGLKRVMPVYAAFFLLVMLSSVGLPSTNGFVGEFLTLLGGWAASVPLTVIAASGVILAAVYLLWMFQRVFYGVPSEKNAHLPDLNLREIAILVPIVVLIFWIGLYPSTFTDAMQASVDNLIRQVNGDAGAAWLTQMGEGVVQNAVR